MSRNEVDIHDDELRVIGQKRTPHSSEDIRHKKLWWWIAAALLICGIIAAVFLFSGKKEDMSESEAVVFEPMIEPDDNPVAEEVLAPLGDYSDTTLTKAYTEHLRDTINDIPLDIYIPHNAVPELVLGVPDIHDKSIVLTTQAADIRADNGKIVGAFVLKGRPLSWGLSKKGYCGIIDGKLNVGVADNSPLFEEATEKEGYFFRQYPLVDNGVLVENEPKGKSIRKALCDRNGEIMVVMSQTPESFHDFAQALVDLKVDNAIYLVGSSSFGYFRDRYDHLAIIYNKFRYGYQYENFIVWKAQ
jgi:hypothetical protein